MNAYIYTKQMYRKCSNVLMSYMKFWYTKLPQARSIFVRKSEVYVWNDVSSFSKK